MGSCFEMAANAEATRCLSDSPLNALSIRVSRPEDESKIWGRNDKGIAAQRIAVRDALVRRQSGMSECGLNLNRNRHGPPVEPVEALLNMPVLQERYKHTIMTSFSTVSRRWSAQLTRRSFT